MKKYYLHDGSKEIGPLSIEDLKSQKLTKETPVWYEGLDTWSQAGDIEELKTVLVNLPPPFINSDSQGTPVSIENSERRIKGPKLNYVKWALGLGLLIVVILFGLNYLNSRSHQDSYSGENIIESIREKSPEELRQELLEKEQNSPTEYLNATGGWRENLIGEIVVEGEVHNSATIASFKDILIRVTFLTKTDNELGSEERTIFDFLSPNGTLTFKYKFDASSSTKGVRIEVISAKSA